jgi:citrate lyase subunit beta/citryl-CoA lyase
MVRQIRPPALRRSWLFLPGAERERLLSAGGSGADVLIQEQEYCVPLAQREHARTLSREVIDAWRAAGVVTAVRINPLWDDGLADLAAAIQAGPDIIMVPKVSDPHYVADVDKEIGRFEAEYGLPPGSTELVPNVESARGLMQTYTIARFRDRVTACLITGEEMATSLGAERGPDGVELAYARARFHLECRAAGAISIDCPYPWRDEPGLLAEAHHARRLGYTAKSALVPEHARVINRVFTPSEAEVAAAQALVAAFEATRNQAGAPPGDAMIELPPYQAARRLLERAAALAALD